MVLIVLPKTGLAEPAPHAFMGWYLFLWGVFTLFMYLGTREGSPVLRFVFLSLTVLFMLLAVRDWTGSETIGTIAGFEGIICGASAFYLAMAEVLHEVRGRCRTFSAGASAVRRQPARRGVFRRQFTHRRASVGSGLATQRTQHSFEHQPVQRVHQIPVSQSPQTAR